ncbi:MULTISPECIES: hypothetical protein [unclassified Micromonospora]|uniref:hypothetical protein n=1 Tax=unclassified Micromonospora TaxID=2617518 RepID=UPI00104C8017|nr:MULTISPECIES: hypothetical protein [unclassified Micromonospora]TDB69700.1 hypothetical protein E1182_29230 [Micromonospora sp. KC721]TDC29847.1 hypothetical protein E1166_29560 [Micromonospora sp. KC213]
MTGVGEAVAQLLAIRERLDEAAVTALRAQAEAEQAFAHVAEVRGGSSDQPLKAAVADIEVARDKAGRYARLLADAARHISAYVNVLAPGAAPSEVPAENAAPSGERLVTEAEARGRRADIAWRRQVQKADDTEDSLKNAETSAKEVFKFLKQQHRDQGGTATGTTPQQHAPAQERPQVDNPVTAAVMAAGALAVVAKAVWNHGRDRRARKRDDDDQS